MTMNKSNLEVIKASNILVLISKIISKRLFNLFNIFESFPTFV